VEDMNRKLDMIDRAIYEKSLEKRLLREVLEQGSPRNNEPHFEDFEGSPPGTVFKIGPGLESDPSEGTYAVMIQSGVIGGRRAWQRKYGPTAPGAATRVARLHRQLAIKAKDAFRDARIRLPLAYGPHEPINQPEWRKAFVNSANKTYVKELFVCRGNPLPGANIRDITPGGGSQAPRLDPYRISHKFYCYTVADPGEEWGNVKAMWEFPATPWRSTDDIPDNAEVAYYSDDLAESQYVDTVSELKSEIIEQDGSSEDEYREFIQRKWQAFKSKCWSANGALSRWYIDDRLHQSSRPPAEDEETEDDAAGPWSEQVGKVVWGWRPIWHYRIIGVPDNENIGEVEMRVVDFEWENQPERKERDNFTFHLRDISSDHRLTQHVRALLNGTGTTAVFPNDGSTHPILVNPQPPEPNSLQELRVLVQEMIGGGPNFNVNKKTSWEGWTHEADDHEDSDCVDEQNDADGDPPSNLIGKEVGDDSRSSMGGSARLVPESQIRDLIMNEIQQMTMNPFMGEEVLPPQDVSRPVVHGSVQGATNSSDAAAQFASGYLENPDQYNISCEQAAGTRWTCTANKSELGSEQNISFPGEEGQGLDEP